MLNHKSYSVFKLKARGRCLQALLRETNGQELSNSRLLLYTEDDGKAWLLARLSAKIERGRNEHGAGEVADTNKALRSFFSVVGDLMLDKTTQWATDGILQTGLWSEGGPLAGDIPSCGFCFRWGPGLAGSGHSGSDRVCANTSQFELEYIGAATDRGTHKKLPDLVRQTDAMVADLQRCRGGEFWKFENGRWLRSDSSRCAARRVVEFVRRMRDNPLVRMSGAVCLVVGGILGPDVKGRARGIGAAYMLAAAFRGLVACSIGNRVVGLRFLKELTSPAAPNSCLREESSLSMISALSVGSTIAEIGAMSPREVETAILSQAFLPVLGHGYGVGVSGDDRCVLDLARGQRLHPAEGILELGASVLPDLSKRYGDRETLLFGSTVVSEREAGTRVAFVRDPVATNLTSHYPTTEIAGFEVSSLSMLLGSLNLTYLIVRRHHAALFRKWIYPALWSRLCSCSYDAARTTHRVLFGYAPRSVRAWNMAGTGVGGGTNNNGPMLSSAALYMATEIIGKKTGSYAGDFGCWCKALGLKRVPETESGIIADAPLVLWLCNVWQTGTGEAVRLNGTGGGYLRLNRGANFDHVEQDVACTPNPTVPPTEESVRLGARVGY